MLPFPEGPTGRQGARPRGVSRRRTANRRRYTLAPVQNPPIVAILPLGLDGAKKPKELLDRETTCPPDPANDQRLRLNSRATRVGACGSGGTKGHKSGLKQR